MQTRQDAWIWKVALECQGYIRPCPWLNMIGRTLKLAIGLSVHGVTTFAGDCIFYAPSPNSQ